MVPNLGLGWASFIVLAGVIDMPIWTKIPALAGRNVPIDPNETAKAAAPLGKVGQAQDIANGVLFLASDASNYMPRAELVIDVWGGNQRHHHRRIIA